MTMGGTEQILFTGNQQQKGDIQRVQKSNLTDRWINTNAKNPNAVKDY